MRIPFNTPTLDLSDEKEAAVNAAIEAAISMMDRAGLTDAEIALSVLSYGSSLCAQIYGANKTGHSFEKHGRELIEENPLH